MYILRFPPHTDIKYKSEEEIWNLGIVCFCFLECISASLCRVINIINNRNAKQHYLQKIPKQTTKRRREEPPIIHSKNQRELIESSEGGLEHGRDLFLLLRDTLCYFIQHISKQHSLKRRNSN